MSSASTHLSTLYRLTQTLNSSLDLETVLNNLIDEVITITHAERGFLMLREANSALTFRVARGLERQTIDAADFKISRSVVDAVAQSGEPIYTDDTQRDEQFSSRASINNLHLRVIMCVPIRFKDETIGVIYVDSRFKRDVFVPADLELFAAIAANAAIAIENARLFRETQDKLKNLRLLHQISADLTSTLDLEHVLIACLQRVQDLLGTAAASVLTVEGAELVFQVAIGAKSDLIKPFRVPITQGAAGWVVTNKQGIIINDLQHDTRFYSKADEETGFTSQALMAAPLVINERTLGVIEVFNKPGGFAQSDLDLLSIIAASASIAIENARLYKVAVEKGRLERELQVARDVQASLLPRELPQIEGWQFAALWQPAREVSGDFYDFIKPDDKKIGWVIADVTDKGMPAALFMSLSRTIIRATLPNAATPADGITRANKLICADSVNNMFVTFVYAEIDVASGDLVYVNAGHNPPLLFRAADDSIAMMDRGGMPLGIDDTITFNQKNIHLEHGDVIFLYTDGLTDATDANDNEFGIERTKKIFQTYRHAHPQEIIAAIQIALRNFAGDAPPYDDVTLAILKRT